MASEAMDVDKEVTSNDGSQKKTGATSTSHQASPLAAAAAAAPPASRYKYKYPEAYPTPPGEDDEKWNKIFTAADSRLYNRHGKSAVESKKYRTSGETYKLALQMLAEKNAKEAAIAAGVSVPSSSKVSTPKAAAKKPQNSTSIKKEPSTSSRDATPATDKMSTMSISEKIKSEGRARKAPSVAPSDNDAQGSSAAVKMGSPATPHHPAPKAEKPKKKGTAAPVKKRAPKPKAEDTTDTPNSSRRPSATPAFGTGPSSGEESNDGGEYCICRGPDDHRMMVYCEGGCEDWYHCSCLKIDETDAKELLDRFICPKCETDTLFTTWKRMCRFLNVGLYLGHPYPCRKAARVSAVPPSKYCSDIHRGAFWEFVRDSLTRQDEEPSRGGRLSAGEVGWLLNQDLSVPQFHALGSKPRLLPPSVDPNHSPGLDHLTAEEETLLLEWKARQTQIDVDLYRYKDQEKLRVMIVARAEKAAEHLLKSKSIKKICGYDSRLAMNQAEFEKWRTSEEGDRALRNGRLGPATGETRITRGEVLSTHDVLEASDVLCILDNICLEKKCNQHLHWASFHKEEFRYQINLLVREKNKLAEKINELIEDAETREAMEPEYSDNVTIQLF